MWERNTLYFPLEYGIITQEVTANEFSGRHVWFLPKLPNLGYVGWEGTTLTPCPAHFPHFVGRLCNR